MYRTMFVDPTYIYLLVCFESKMEREFTISVTILPLAPYLKHKAVYKIGGCIIASLLYKVLTDHICHAPANEETVENELAHGMC